MNAASRQHRFSVSEANKLKGMKVLIQGIIEYCPLNFFRPSPP